MDKTYDFISKDRLQETVDAYLERKYGKGLLSEAVPINRELEPTEKLLMLKGAMDVMELFHAQPVCRMENVLDELASLRENEHMEAVQQRTRGQEEVALSFDRGEAAYQTALQIVEKAVLAVGRAPELNASDLDFAGGKDILER